MSISHFKKRAFAPFFVIGALFCLLQASRSTEFISWWLGLCLLVALIHRQQERRFVLSWISGLLVCFCLLLFTHTLYLNPAYHVAGIYLPATLVLAFVSTTHCTAWFVQTGFKLFSGVIALIAVWALLQWLTGWGFVAEQNMRTQTLFATPNTLATALNLCLVPMLAFYLLGHGRRGVYGLALLLFAALLSTQSRGGYLGLLSGIVFFVGFVGQVSIVAQWRRYRAVAIGFVAILVFFKLYAELGLADWSLDSVFATLNHGDSSYRWEIYQLVWHGLTENLWFGIGYFNFGYYFETHKVPPFLDSSTLFVHNDYLQFALEIGLWGLSLFVLLIIVVYWRLFRFRQQALVEQRLPLILSASAITSMLIHALVDYPFYIPVLLAVFGGYLGIINVQLIDMGVAVWQLPTMSAQHFLGLRPCFINNVLVIALIAWLGLPAFAEISADYGLQRLQQGDAQQGLYWHGVARTLQPRDANYYWQEGIIWRDQGIAQAKPELLEKSLALFSKGLAVNPFEVNNLLEKIALYRQYGKQFKQPATVLDIMTWIKHAKSLQPQSIGLQMEYVRCLDFAGERQQAFEQAKILVERRPQSRAVQKLLDSMQHD